MIFANITTAVFYIRKLIKIVIYTFFHLQVLGLSVLHHIFSLQSLCYGAFVILLSGQQHLNVLVFFPPLPNENPAFCNNASEADQTGLKELPCCLPERQRIVSYSDVRPFFRILAGFRCFQQITPSWRWEGGCQRGKQWKWFL